jgi:hypothetical protein
MLLNHNKSAQKCGTKWKVLLTVHTWRRDQEDCSDAASQGELDEQMNLSQQQIGYGILTITMQQGITRVLESTWIRYA